MHGKRIKIKSSVEAINKRTQIAYTVFSKVESMITTPQTGFKITWIQVINAISEFMRLYVHFVQKTQHEVFGNLAFFEGGG